MLTVGEKHRFSKCPGWSNNGEKHHFSRCPGWSNNFFQIKLCSDGFALDLYFSSSPFPEQRAAVKSWHLVC